MSVIFRVVHIKYFILVVAEEIFTRAPLTRFLKAQPAFRLNQTKIKVLITTFEGSLFKIEYIG